MVFTVGNAPESNKTDYVGVKGNDVDAENGKDVKVAIPTYYSRERKNGRCCVVVPWILFIACFLLLGCSMYWGWQQHCQLKKVLENIQEKENMGPDAFQGSDSERPLIPYGNDALSDDEGLDVREDVYPYNLPEKPQDGGNALPESVAGYSFLTISMPSFADFNDIFSNMFGNLTITYGDAPIGSK